MNPFNNRLYVQQYTFVRTSSNRNGVRQGECQEKRFTSMRSYFVNVWDLSHVKAMATFSMRSTLTSLHSKEQNVF